MLTALLTTFTADVRLLISLLRAFETMLIALLSALFAEVRLEISFERALLTTDSPCDITDIAFESVETSCDVTVALVPPPPAASHDQSKSAAEFFLSTKPSAPPRRVLNRSDNVDILLLCAEITFDSDASETMIAESLFMLSNCDAGAMISAIRV